MKKTILVTGARGYIGTYVVRKLSAFESYNVISFNEDVRSTHWRLPDAEVIIHLAGLPNSYRGPAQDIMEVNYRGTMNLLDNTTERCHFIFLSSDYVFRSDPEKIYREYDAVDPETYYGESKAMAEKAVLSHAKRKTVLRTSMVYGYFHPRRNNFFSFLNKHLEEGKTTELFGDVYSCPTHVEDLVRCIHRCIQRETFGILHACGSEWISRFDLGRLFCELHDYPPRLLKKCEKPRELPIPRYLRMQSSTIFEREIRTSLKEGLQQCLSTSS